MKNKLRCAVVGLGRIAWGFHLPAIVENPGFELAALVDPCRDRLEEAGNAFHTDGLYPDLTEMLRNVRPDLAVIASPTLFHERQTLECLESGTDVFCDKPIALNVDSARKMFRAAAAFGRKLMVYQPHRCTPEALAARRIVDSGKLGDIFMLERNCSNFVRRNDWQAFLANGGGMLLNYGAHYIDQLLWLSRCRRTGKISCDMRKILSCGDAEDVVSARFTTDRGILLGLSINQAAALPLPELRFCGSSGTALKMENGVWKIRYFKRETLRETPVHSSLTAPGRQYPREDIRWIEETCQPPAAEPGGYYGKCHDYFALDKEPFIQPEETLEVLRVIDECKKDSSQQMEELYEKNHKKI